MRIALHRRSMLFVLGTVLATLGACWVSDRAVLQAAIVPQQGPCQPPGNNALAFCLNNCPNLPNGTPNPFSNPQGAQIQCIPGMPNGWGYGNCGVKNVPCTTAQVACGLFIWDCNFPAPNQLPPQKPNPCATVAPICK